ncbi:MAG: hypothetical protein Q7K38_00975 [Candidatus Wildermuthbacteria bacterium]|nr:hypothetical protein [Candidatus Wildermuthbacteria bacterium]
MRSPYFHLKPRVVALRKLGKTYGEIRRTLGIIIPKSTLSDWCSNILLSPEQQAAVNRTAKKASDRGLATAWLINKARRVEYIKTVKGRVIHLSRRIEDKDTAKIALAMLYLGEGAKRTSGSLMFGNSDPSVVGLFLRLLRNCYEIDERKFRCTLQCRADQDIKKLEKLWSRTTKIPLSQFYSARIDPRTIGKPSMNPDYKGVCRIDYFSGDIFIELKQIVEVIFEGPVA